MGLLGTIGGILGGNKAKKAAEEQSRALTAAGQTAFDASRFRPVGVTTAFGTSDFNVDPTTGALLDANYTLNPQLLGAQQGLLNQAYGQGMDFTGQGLQGAQSLFNLGQQYLAQSPQEAAQQYMTQQQALLQPGRDQAAAGLTQNLFNTGRGGVAVSQGGGMGAANPELQALLNAQAGQDLQLAANAQQAGMDQTKFGAGLFGYGSEVAKSGYAPFQTALAGATGIENLGQDALKLGMGLGETATNANTRAAQLRLGTAAPAAQAQYAASSYSPWAAALGGLDKMGDQAISAMTGNLFGMGGSISTPMTYGTNYGSQQTNMLAAQDAWFK